MLCLAHKIPDRLEDGYLAPGTYLLTKDEFIDSFCSYSANDDSGISRNAFHRPFYEIYQWAADSGATSMVIGGSFVTNKLCPTDLDILIFFSTSEELPKSSERISVDGVLLDIQLLSEDQPEIKAAFLELLSTTRSQIPHGLVQIKFHSKAATHTPPEKRSRVFDIVKTAYLGRKYAHLDRAVGLIVPIHGIRNHGEWFAQVSLIASTSGWAVAPYYYGFQDGTILFDESAKRAALQGLRGWLSDVGEHWRQPISIIAHSFGTYLVARYLQEAKDIAIPIDSIIFCGSIVTTAYDWMSLLDGGKVGAVLNTISERDQWVRLIPEGLLSFIDKDQLFGKAGVEGFTDKHAKLREITSQLLDHNNTFRFDVIRGQWLPFLKYWNGSYNRTQIELLRNRLTPP